MPVYISSRNRENSCTSHEAVIHGLAADGGLYTPASIDSCIDVKDLIHASYQETAMAVLQAMCSDYSHEELHECVYGAYDTKFDTDEIVPVTATRDGWMMELWHGPTSAFKDIALTILPRLLTAAYRKENRNDLVSILTATSGDTGKAALSGFADVPHTAITVFYPEIGVSAIQKMQMRTSRGNNVKVIAVRGNFDDCQRMVKEAVSSAEVKNACHGVTISSANSINAGRLIPQITYYFYAYAQLVKRGAVRCGDPVSFCVPTGNFGDILAGYLAKLLGLPVHKLICASNSNHVLTDFFETGTYSLDREFITTISPSMDILISSNLERLLFMLSGNDDAFVRKCMADLQEKGSYSIPRDMLEEMQKTFAGAWADEDACRREIRRMYEEEGIVIDPHTSVAFCGLKQYRKASGDDTPCIVLSTASPYKFSKDVLASLGAEETDDDFAAMEKLHELSGMPVPKGLAELKELPLRFHEVIDIEDGMKTIAKRMEELRHD